MKWVNMLLLPLDMVLTPRNIIFGYNLLTPRNIIFRVENQSNIFAWFFVTMGAKNADELWFYEKEQLQPQKIWSLKKL